MAAQAGLCLGLSKTPEDTFSHGKAHMYIWCLFFVLVLLFIALQSACFGKRQLIALLDICLCVHIMLGHVSTLLLHVGMRFLLRHTFGKYRAKNISMKLVPRHVFFIGLYVETAFQLASK